jgi:hypothetical protein
MHDTRRTLSRRLPANYFADAQAHTLAAPENLGRSEQSGAESRETSGESGAAILSPASHPTMAGHNSPHGTTGASPALDKEPAPSDDTATGRQGTLSGWTTMEARIRQDASHDAAQVGQCPIHTHSTAGGVTTSGASCDSAAPRARHTSGIGHRAYSVAAERIAHAQQLRAARIISGRS